jgi:hypothetical protein
MLPPDSLSCWRSTVSASVWYSPAVGGPKRNGCHRVSLKICDENLNLVVARSVHNQNQKLNVVEKRISFYPE